VTGPNRPGQHTGPTAQGRRYRKGLGRSNRRKGNRHTTLLQIGGVHGTRKKNTKFSTTRERERKKKSSRRARGGGFGRKDVVLDRLQLAQTLERSEKGANLNGEEGLPWAVGDTGTSPSQKTSVVISGGRGEEVKKTTRCPGWKEGGGRGFFSPLSERDLRVRRGKRGKPEGGTGRQCSSCTSARATAEGIARGDSWG